MWTKKERFEAVLNHELADRPPVSAWRHFTENEHSGADLFVETMLKWQNTYDWDYVKLQPRASYYEEAWGGQFDYNDYEGVLPKVVKGPIGGVADLEKITVLPGDQGVFAEQIEVIQKMKAGLNEDIPTVPDHDVPHQRSAEAVRRQPHLAVTAPQAVTT